MNLGKKPNGDDVIEVWCRDCKFTPNDRRGFGATEDTALSDYRRQVDPLL